MKIKRRQVWSTNRWVYEAFECGKVIAKAPTKQELRQKLRAVAAAKKTECPAISSENSA